MIIVRQIVRLYVWQEKENGRVRVLNTIRGNDAIFAYAWLTGLATLKNEQNKRRGYESEDKK